jgi:hypothetical protein
MFIVKMPRIQVKEGIMKVARGSTNLQRQTDWNSRRSL